MFIAQPVAERIADQEKGKARRKSEQQHRKRFGPQVIGNPVLARTHAVIVYRKSSKLNQVFELCSEKTEEWASEFW